MQTLNHTARFKLLFILVLIQSCGDTTPGKVNNQLVGRYWDSEGTTDLELESNREYRFIGEGGSNFRNGTWGAEGSMLYFDDKSCPYTYSKDSYGISSISSVGTAASSTVHGGESQGIEQFRWSCRI